MKFFSHFDSALQKEVAQSEFEKLLPGLKQLVGHVRSVTISNAEYIEDEGGLYSLLYNIKTNDKDLQYYVHLKNKSNGISVRRFNISIQDKDPNRGFTFLHFIVVTMFIICILAQIYSLVFFIRAKKYKIKVAYTLFCHF